MNKLLSVIVIIIVGCAFSECGKDDEFNIDVRQHNAEVYHEQSVRNNKFNYGYQVEKENSQFQHKVKGPDDVTYGCYGYIDPNNEKHLVYYVADRLGYRVVTPNQPTKIFTERVSASINQLNEDLKDKKLEERVVAWNDLYLPESCRRLNEILTPVVQRVNPVEPQLPIEIKTTQKPLPPKTTPRPVIVLEPIAENTFVTNRVDLNADKKPNNIKISTNSSLEVPPWSHVPLISRPITSVENPPRPFSPAYPIGVVSTRSPVTTTIRARQRLRGTAPPRPAQTQQPIQRLTPSGEDILANSFPTPATTAALVSSTTIRPVHRNTPPPARRPVQPVPEKIQPAPKGNQNLDCNNPFGSCSKEPLNYGQYNGYVYPINGDCRSTEYNVKHLMKQMEALNAQVLELTANIRALQRDNSNISSTAESCCNDWLHRLQAPLLVYVPILLPYVGSDLPGERQSSLLNPASYAFQKMCDDCS